MREKKMKKIAFSLGFLGCLLVTITVQADSIPTAPHEKGDKMEVVDYQGRKVRVVVDEESHSEKSRNQKEDHAMGAFVKGRSRQGTEYITDQSQGKPAWDFIDVSSHNGNLTKEDFDKIRNAGVKGVCVKLTEGTWYRNPCAPTQIKNAKAAGLQVSTYHFSHFTSKKTAEAEADYYAAYARELGLPNDTVMVNDFEVNDCGEFTNGASNSVYFAKRLILNDNFDAVLHYASASTFDTVLNPSIVGETSMWVAGYPYTPSASHLQYTNRAAWQWTDNMHFKGVNSQFDASVDYTGYFTKDFKKEEKPSFHSYHAYASVTKEVPLYNDFAPLHQKGTTKEMVGQTYFIKGYYDYKGRRYYSLYNKEDKWQGYVCKEDINESEKPCGSMFSAPESYASVVKNDYNAWRETVDFKSVKRTPAETFNKTYYVKGVYHHFNGAQYASLYNDKDEWQGYMNVHALSFSDRKKGAWHKEPQYATIAKDDYNVWGELENFKKKKTTSRQLYQKTVVAKGWYRHWNGALYYSLYTKDDEWLGYINANAVKTSEKPCGAYLAYGKKVTIKHDDYTIWRELVNFKSKKGQSAQYLHKTLTAKGRYHHINGAWYYSLYNDKDEWLGYINVNACK